MLDLFVLRARSQQLFSRGTIQTTDLHEEDKRRMCLEAKQWWGAMDVNIQERFLGSRAYVEVSSIAQAGGIVIVPLGAMEQHGPHMPLFTDTLVVQSLVIGALLNLPSDHSFYFTYPLSYSYSVEHLSFPGTVALRAETTMMMLMDIANSLARAGFQKVIFLNGHGGNVGLLQVVAREMRIHTGAWFFVVNAGSLAEETPFDDMETQYGIHAGATETSVVLSQMPQWVSLDRIVSEYPVLSSGMLQLEGRFPVAWVTKDISSTGVIGGATKASKEVGERIFEAMVQKLVQVLLDIAKFNGLSSTLLE